MRISAIIILTQLAEGFRQLAARTERYVMLTLFTGLIIGIIGGQLYTRYQRDGIYSERFENTCWILSGILLGWMILIGIIVGGIPLTAASAGWPTMIGLMATVGLGCYSHREVTELAEQRRRNRSCR